eukprot:15415447-Alexandrium_andersonii.AAC.1
MTCWQHWARPLGRVRPKVPPKGLPPSSCSVLVQSADPWRSLGGPLKERAKHRTRTRHTHHARSPPHTHTRH